MQTTLFAAGLRDPFVFIIQPPAPPTQPPSPPVGCLRGVLPEPLLVASECCGLSDLREHASTIIARCWRRTSASRLTPTPQRPLGPRSHTPPSVPRQPDFGAFGFEDPDTDAAEGLSSQPSQHLSAATGDAANVLRATCDMLMRQLAAVTAERDTALSALADADSSLTSTASVACCGGVSSMPSATPAVTSSDVPHSAAIARTEHVLPPGLGLTFGPELPSLADARAARAAADSAATAAAAIAAGTAPIVRGRNGSMSRRYLRAAAFSARRSAAAAAELAATVGMHAANRVLQAVQPRTWTWLWACQVVRRHAVDAIARARTVVARRARALALLARRPRALNYDVGYDAETQVFTYRTPRGEILTTHPHGSAGQPVPAYAPDGSVIEPRQPSDESDFVLAPEVNGGWCYRNPATGETVWHAPADSKSLQTRKLVSPPAFNSSPPELPRAFVLMSPMLQRLGRWMPLFQDHEHRVLMLNLDTGAARKAPWISLRTEDGCTFFANLFTRETRWFPPHHWMEDWVSRAILAGNGQRHGTRVFCQYLCEQSPLLRHMLDPLVARLCVEGGAPYFYERGLPQYEPDEDDTAATHPAYAETHSAASTR